MCGIVGYIGSDSALPVIISGLEKLEYRGYDSAGVAIFEDGDVYVARAEGKLAELKKEVAKSSKGKAGSLGIGHTRWATHGKPSETNAHPHTAGRVSLIHNGIIENYVELREKLQAAGRQFLSETDTEIAAHLLDYKLQIGLEPFEALKSACSELRGSYAFVAIDKDNPDRLLVAKNATPIILGVGEGEVIVASDIPAVLEKTRKVMILEDGDVLEVSLSGIRVQHNGEDVTRSIETVTWDPVTAQKGGYRHYMLKEIHEQAQVATDTFRGRIEYENQRVVLDAVNLSDEDIKGIDRIVLVACGTAWHSCLLAKFYLEDLVRIPCEVDYASEFRYRSGVFDEKTLVVAVSQSGETADTLAAIECVKGVSKTMAVCNVLGSSIARAVDHVFFTQAGPEISVASTKAFTAQLIAAYLLAANFGLKRGTLSVEREAALVRNLTKLPAAIEEAISGEDEIQRIAHKYHGARDFLFIGRGSCFPIALEGALKMKEISYIHAEGYPAGEMKHGPLALIDEDVPIVVVLQNSELLFEKTLSNLREAHSRRGRIIAVTDIKDHGELKELCEEVIEVPFVSDELSPIVLNVPLQLLSYHAAVFNGTDVDQPRNLAKSVTVE